jgi:hypothetical protein
MSSDEAAAGEDEPLDEAQVDAILENAASSDGSNGEPISAVNGADSSAVHLSGARSAAAASRAAGSGIVPPLSAASALRPPLQSSAGSHASAGSGSSGTRAPNEVDRILGNGWRKYYIDSPSVMSASTSGDVTGQRRSGGGGSGLVGPFERGSSQRVTLPLPGGSGITAVSPGGLLVKRSQQSVVTDLRSSSAGRCRDDGSSVAADAGRRQDGGMATNELGAASSSSLQRYSGSGSGGMFASRPSSSSEEQRGERLSNYSRGGVLLQQRANNNGQMGGDIKSTDDDDDDEWSQTMANVESGAGEQVSDDVETVHQHRGGGGSVDGGSSMSRSNFVSGVSGSSIVHKDGGQGPAPQPFYSPGGAMGGFHDYVNINYVNSSRSLGRNAGNRVHQNGFNVQQLTRTNGGGMGHRFPGGRMAMSETESIENIAVAAAGWPAGGRPVAGQRCERELVQRSDSCRSSSTDNETRHLATNSLPRCGSAAQVWRNDPAAGLPPNSASTAAMLRMQAGYGYCNGGLPGRSGASSVYSTPLLSGGKSRLSASKDDSCK